MEIKNLLDLNNLRSAPELSDELLKKLQTQNTAYKKLLSFKCESPDSPINKYLDEVWEKRFRDLK